MSRDTPTNNHNICSVSIVLVRPFQLKLWTESVSVMILELSVRIGTATYSRDTRRQQQCCLQVSRDMGSNWKGLTSYIDTEQILGLLVGFSLLIVARCIAAT